MTALKKNEGAWCVYRIEFSEARRYVGITTYLERRLRNHKSPASSGNSQLCQLMRSEPYKVTVLAEGLTHAEASEMERDVTRKLKNPLNWTYAYGKDKGNGKFETVRNYNPNWHHKAPCRTCGKSLPATDFWRDSARNNGLSSECIKCAKSKRYPPRRTGKHPCHVCRQRKDASEFHACTSRKSGLDSKCKECRLAVQRMINQGKSKAERSAQYKEALRLIRAGEEVPYFYQPKFDYGEFAGTTSKCRCCGKRKPIEKFVCLWRRSGMAADGAEYLYVHMCRACMKAGKQVREDAL